MDKVELLSRINAESARSRVFLRLFLAASVVAAFASLALIALVTLDFSSQLSWPWSVPWYVIALAAVAAGSFVGIFVASAGALYYEARTERATERLVAALEQVPRAKWDMVPELSGWKIAKVVGPDAASLRFSGIGYGNYSVSDTAVCEVGEGHEVPSVGCSCGFHAFYHRPRALREWRAYPFCVLLRVEGFGHAVEHESGWRAQMQEVLTVWLPNTCSSCSRPCDGVSYSGRRQAWVPSCGPCSKSRPLFSTQELAALWGTEVRLMAD